MADPPKTNFSPLGTNKLGLKFPLADTKFHRMEDALLEFYRIKPLKELNNRELVGPSDRVGGTCSSPPVMLNPERTTRSTSVVSFSDEEDLYSAEDRTPRSRNRELINPRTSLDFFKIEHIEHSALQNSTPTSSLSRNQEPIVPPTNSDIESLKSVSEPESDNESWVNEPTLVELEERLCEKSKLMKRLCHTIVTSAKEREISELRHKKQLQEEARKVEESSRKLQAAGVRVENLQIKHNEELVAEKIRLNRAIEILEGNTSLIASLETAHKKNLTFVKAQYDRRLFVVEKRRLSELAELEKRIQKCEEDWAAERRGFVEKLEAKTNYEDDYLTKSCSGISLSARALGSRLQKAAKCNRELQARLQSFNEYQEAIAKQILLHEDTILKEHALKLTESSIRIPANSPRPLGHNRVEFPAPLLIAQIRGLQQQVADITEERKSEKEMHMILQCRYFNLHSKHMAKCAQPGSLVEPQLRLAFLEKNRVPELTGQIEELEREIRSRDDLHRQEKENQESKYEKLLLDYNEPGKESKQEDKTELEMFRKIKVPALLGQVSGLQQLVVRIKAQHAKQGRLGDSVISVLAAKYETLSKEHDEACASYQRVQEAQNDLRPQKELQQQLADFKVSMEDMSKVQKARYEVLDIQMSSVLRHDAKDTCSKYDLLVHAHTQLQANFRTAEQIQMQLEQSRNQMEVEKNTLEHEKDWLERRLKESDRRVYWAHHASRDNCKQRQNLMNLNYRLKRDTVKMARDKMSAKIVEEYAMQSIDALDMRPSS